MCFVTLGAISAAAGVAGAGVSAFGAVEGGQATADAAAYNAKVASNNAIIANQNAAYAVNAGLVKAGNVSEQNAAQVGAVKTELAANNVDVGSGSAVDVVAGQREKGELDAQTALNNAELQAYGYKSQATGFTAQAGLETQEAEQAPIGADIGAAGGLLSSASSLGFKWSGGLGTPAPTPTNAGPELVGA
jgi:hypothetical protein